MLEGFHTFKPYQLSAPCQYVSHLLLDNALCREGSSALFYDSEVWRPPPPSLDDTRTDSLHPLCPPEVPGQQL